ncbi:hypothetical protein O181_036886 [Austropuccinia psidii MF-1]|uniref:Reverse transcriptase domain-containing protein n=1 Tax=Austropuccinia psidii MF-1 TaxID=1389203 RepID=A0A9Q3HAA6_9BASI|nr:hypothetical protein [Austropuccinia psidii MF-1]
MFTQEGGQADLSNIEPIKQKSPLTFNKITKEEVSKNIGFLSQRKAPGPDKIPNELIKILKTTITDSLENFLNSCLQLGHFPRFWKTETTVITQKENKANYEDPSAY